MELPQPPPNPASPIEVPEGYPRPIIFGLFEGSRGSGKTYCATQFVAGLWNVAAINRVFLISPTYHTNAHLWQFAHVDPNDAFIRIDQAEAALKEIVTRVKADKSTYDFYVEVKQAIAAYKRGENLTARQQQLVEAHGDHVLVDLKPPRPCLVIDDMSHSKLMKGSSYFVNLCLRNRHIAPGVGLNILVLTQSVKNGLPRVLRQNVNLWAIWPTRDRSVLKDDIYPEVSGQLSFAQFEEIYQHAIRDGPHSYLVIDMTQGDRHKVFRKGLSGPWLEPDQS